LDKSGLVIGGKHLLNGSIEYDYLLRPDWRLATFYDTGNAFNDFDDLDWQQSIGIGLRWLSPIGPVRFDLAHGIKDQGVRFHITMGPDL
jgi:translocation and assembly module TamA